MELDHATALVVVEAVYSYRLYPSSEGFQDITLGFQKDGDDKSYCEHVTICTPDGICEEFNREDLTFKEYSDGGEISLKTTIPVTEVAKGHDRLDVELKLFEFGKDHWTLYAFKALQPTDGFKLHLHCEGDLKIKCHSVFVVGANYYLDISPDESDISITCHQWINEGAGLAILIALPHDKRNWKNDDDKNTALTPVPIKP